MKIVLASVLAACVIGCPQSKVPLKSANNATVKAYVDQAKDLQTQLNKLQQDAMADLQARNKPVQDAIAKATPDLQQQLNANLQEVQKSFNAKRAPIDQQTQAIQQKLNLELAVARKMQGLPDTAVPGTDDQGKTFYFTVPKK